MKAHDYQPNANAVLILAADPLAGALIGAALEISGSPPAYPQRNEGAKEALRRIRPRCVLLSDEEPALHDHAFMGPAMMTGARLFVFGPERAIGTLQTVIDRYQLGVIALPRDVEALPRLVTATSESSRRRPESTAP